MANHAHRYFLPLTRFQEGAILFMATIKVLKSCAFGYNAPAQYAKSCLHGTSACSTRERVVDTYTP